MNQHMLDCWCALSVGSTSEVCTFAAILHVIGNTKKEEKK